MLHNIRIDYYTTTPGFDPTKERIYHWKKFKWFRNGNIVLVRDSKNGIDTVIQLIEDPRIMTETEKKTAGKWGNQKYLCHYDVLRRDDKSSPSKKRISAQLRDDILKRDNYTCAICGKQYDKSRLEVDHKLEYSQNGLSIDDNLVTLCKGCHKVKTCEFKRDSINALWELVNSPNVQKR